MKETLSSKRLNSKYSCVNCGKTKDRHYLNPDGKYECEVTYDSKPNVNMKFRPACSGKKGCDHKWIGSDVAGIVNCLYCGLSKDLRSPACSGDEI